MVGCGCDTFANQHRVGSGAGIILKFHRSEHSRFRYADHIVRQIGGKLVVFVHIDLEILEISCIDADDSCSGIDRALNLLASVRFDQHRHIEAMRQFKQRLELVVIQRGNNQQHQIGAMRPCLPNLVFRDNEILAQHWNFHGCTDLIEIVKRSKESTTFGQHGNRAGTSFFVFPGQCGRIRNVAKVPFRWRSPFNLRDHRNAIRFFQPLSRINRGRRFECLTLHLIKGNVLFTCSLVFDSSRHQLIEYRHGVPFSILLDWLA